MDQQLLAFVTVAKLENFTRAAEALHTTQPAISQHIQNLERKMGTKLLERTSKYVRLNRAGKIVYQYAADILTMYSQMDRLVADLLCEPSGPLSIGASYTFGEYVLPHVISRFCNSYKDISPVITIANTSQIAKQVSVGELDIGIIEGHCNEDDIQVEPFSEDTMVVVVSNDHPLLGLNTVKPADLEREMWIVREKGSGTREYTDDFFHQCGIQPTSMMEFGSTQIIKEAVEAGLGISFLSKSVLRKELAQQVLAILSVPNIQMKRQFSIVTNKSEFKTNVTQLFHTFLLKNNNIMNM